MARHLGQQYNEEELKSIAGQEFIFTPFAVDERGLVGWEYTHKSKDGELEKDVLYTEELVSMILKYGRTLAEKQANSTIRDAVITIPSYFSPS